MDRRIWEQHYLCSELVGVELDEPNLLLIANLEEISPSGACLGLEQPLPAETVLRVICRTRVFRAKVSGCLWVSYGYMVDIEFQEGDEWSLGEFEPQHLLDLSRLAEAGAPTGGLFGGLLKKLSSAPAEVAPPRRPATTSISVAPGSAW